MELNNQNIALKLIAALHMQGRINDLTYYRIMRKYGSSQGGTYIEQRQSA